MPAPAITPVPGPGGPPGKRIKVKKIKDDLNTPKELFAPDGLYALKCIGCFNKAKQQRRMHLQEAV